jgi:hypothetical protein
MIFELIKIRGAVPLFSTSSIQCPWQQKVDRRYDVITVSGQLEFVTPKSEAATEVMRGTSITIRVVFCGTHSFTPPFLAPVLYTCPIPA